ncbi:MAG TPA: phosphate ABC transporter permease PstA [Allosphingosinicella sp.]|nr:phosphate ABC transporter permease PstA [Allosphingosinicella sp.]
MSRPSTQWDSEAMQARLRKRYASERRFKLAGLAAIVGSLGFLVFLLGTMTWNGAGGFMETRVKVAIDFPRSDLFIDPGSLKGSAANQALAGADIEGMVAAAARDQYGPAGADFISEAAWLRVREEIGRDPTLLQRRADFWLPAASGLEGRLEFGRLKDTGVIQRGFNGRFLTSSDATDPAAVGIWGAFKGSLITMLVTLVIAFPMGVLSALYLEEYAPRNRWTSLIEVSINNLAAVPSIIFGLLGLAVFLNFMNMPRSAPIVGGLTLALMTMPVIVIAGRNALKAVPPSVRDAALGVGASPVQVVFHHVLPLALPGILTGTIIGMARALGETAPLLMIGMRAFIAAPPSGISDPATVLPVQIFLWSDEVSRGFVEKTSAAILVLLAFLMAMNGLAIFLRNKFERRW